MKTIRIANASGFYGDRPSAFREIIEGGPVEVITGDYLAELTMLILGRDRAKDPAAGYAKTFLAQMQDCLALLLERRIKVVVNAGGLNPAGLAERLRELSGSCGLSAKIAYVHGDDVLARAAEFGFGEPMTANAYLGAFGIAEALKAEADIVVTGRVTDASLVVGAAAAHFGWHRTDYDHIAGAMAAGHVIECGTQATGGNYAFFDRIPDLHRAGFPIAEIESDGSAVITKHPGTGGAVSSGTVTAQLVYEITGARYAGPDAVLRMDSIEVTDLGQDRVRLSGALGEPPPDTLKVSVTRLGGFRNEVSYVLTGLEIEKKAELIRSQLADAVPESAVWTLARTDHPDADTQEAASAFLHCVVRDRDPELVGRAFSDLAVHLALASYPGFHLSSPPGAAVPYGSYQPEYLPAEQVPHLVVLPDGSERGIEPAPGRVAASVALAAVPEPQLAKFVPGPSRAAPLGAVVAARSGDKGGDANIGVWVEDQKAWPWLVNALTVSALQDLLPETKALQVERHVLPNLHALNFVVHGLLGEGVASNARFDPQAKALGEWLRSRTMEIPEEFL